MAFIDDHAMLENSQGGLNELEPFERQPLLKPTTTNIMKRRFNANHMAFIG
jgi:hypothetical protein